MITVGKTKRTNDYNACIRSIKLNWFDHYVRRASQLPSRLQHLTTYTACTFCTFINVIASIIASLHFAIVVSPHLSLSLAHVSCFHLSICLFFLRAFSALLHIWLNSSYAHVCVRTGKKTCTSPLLGESEWISESYVTLRTNERRKNSRSVPWGACIILCN